MTGKMNSYSTEIKKIRNLGTIAFIFFGCLGSLVYWNQIYSVSFVFWFFSLIGVSLKLFPYRLKNIYYAILKISNLIGRLNTVLLLTVVFFLVVTPIAIIKKKWGHSEIALKPDEKVKSYWFHRSEPFQSKSRFIKRY